VFWILLEFGVYAWVFTHHRVHTFEAGSPWPWVIGIVGYDLAYYWFHRASHRINLAWSAHVVHHQSEDYTLAVALRQAWFQPQFSRWFYLPLALIGIEPAIYVVAGGISLLYQFWIHTELVGRLGPLEWVLNTPSHHRVHHGTNARYLDKNYGAILIVWDRLFGTFEPETEPVVYGITRPLRSFNAWWANFHYWVEMWDLARRARGWDRLRVWFAPPEWTPAGVERPVGVATAKYDPKPPREVAAFVLVQFGLLSPALGVLMFFAEELGQGTFVGAGALLVVATLGWGGLIERKPWARGLELARVLGTGAFVAWVAGSHLAPGIAGGLALAASVPFAAWLLVRGDRMASPAAVATAA
jgi:sterol desaturase/sphingolipid hydroxylase (fatty acid hydroxylase superfamily)